MYYTMKVKQFSDLLSRHFRDVYLNPVCVLEGKVKKGVVVAPHVPRTEGGLYWGYSVRLASCLSEFCQFINLFPLIPLLSIN